MHPLVFGGLCVGLLGLLYQQSTRFIKRREFQRVHHCVSAPKLAQFEHVIGIALMLENLRSWKAKVFLELTRARFYIAGFTYSAKIAGNRTIFTVEPENIKAIFADRFEDFDVGWVRLRAFAPTIGEVLITSDGARWHHQRAMMRPAFNRRQILDFEFLSSSSPILMSLSAGSPGMVLP